MPAERIVWGVLSTANIGRKLVNPAIAKSANGTLHAVASRDGAKAEAFARAGGFATSHGSYEALLADPAVQAVYIPLPNSLHHRWTIAAAEAGKDVLCEKPLALTAADCRAMAAAARATGVLLMEAFMYRFHPRTERMIALVHGGVLGAPRAIRSTFSFRLASPANIRFDLALGGGALMDVGCYCVNVSRTLAGAEPVEVIATANWNASGVDTELTGILRFASGLVAHFDCALTLERSERVEVSGAQGRLVSEGAFVANADGVLLSEYKGGTATAHEFPGVDQYQRMVEHFAAQALARRAGRPASVRYGPEEATANLAVIEALLRSARAGGRPEPVVP
ncbi:MAG: Gfo/Idh/MocA family oxidoreductase [Gemmatimonadetes bacterium]|nr:Gfo/Idh/MocA family oxidoreductase [Gemmatimonadota bacterium]